MKPFIILFKGFNKTMNGFIILFKGFRY